MCYTNKRKRKFVRHLFIVRFIGQELLYTKGRKTKRTGKDMKTQFRKLKNLNRAKIGFSIVFAICFAMAVVAAAVSDSGVSLMEVMKNALPAIYGMAVCLTGFLLCEREEEKLIRRLKLRRRRQQQKCVAVRGKIA